MGGSQLPAMRWGLGCTAPRQVHSSSLSCLSNDLTLQVQSQHGALGIPMQSKSIVPVITPFAKANFAIGSTCKFALLQILSIFKIWCKTCLHGFLRKSKYRCVHVASFG